MKTRLISMAQVIKKVQKIKTLELGEDILATAVAIAVALAVLFCDKKLE
jgi:hypothetical protein